MQGKYITVSGNIGSGKTTLTRLLAKHFKWKAHYEGLIENPYLNDFYEDMQRWSFNLQVSFLYIRFNEILELMKSNKTVILDRSIYEDGYIFAPNLHSMSLMTTRDFETYTAMFNLVVKNINPPDLMIYLRASVPTLVNQIQKRARPYEESIRIDYLRRLNERYEAWIDTYEGEKTGKLIVINIDENNFSEVDEDLSKVIHLVERELFGGIFNP